MKKNAKTEKKQQEQERRKQQQEQTRQKQQKVLDSLSGSIDNIEEALKENEADIIEEEAAAEEAEQAVFDPALPTVKKRKTLFAAGLFIIVMTVIGIVTSVRFIADTIGDIANQTALKEEMADFIYPLVITDVPAFSSPSEAPNSVVIVSAIWNIILNGDTDKYERSGSDMIISEIDVESSAAALYGYGLALTHETVRLGDIVFTYNESSRSYTVAENPRVNSYYPVIRDVSAVGELYTLTVDYYSPSSYAYKGDELGESEKSMIYVVSRTATSTTVQSVDYESISDMKD